MKNQVVNKKLKWAIPLIGIAVIISVVAILAICNSSKRDDIENALKVNFEVSAENAAIKETSSSAMIDTLIKEKSRFEIVGHSKNEVTVAVTTPNMKALCSSMIDRDARVLDATNEIEKIENTIIGALTSGNYDEMTTTIVLQIEKTETGIEIVDTYEYANILSGGLMDLYLEILKEASK